VSPATKIFLAVDAIDMRKGFEGLHGLVSDHLGQDPLSGHPFLFTNKPRTRLKALVWDGFSERGSRHCRGTGTMDPEGETWRR
jgi:transposase